MNLPLAAVWFSCGAASAVALKLSLRDYGATHELRFLNNPVAEEDPDNRRFLCDVEDWCGVHVEDVRNPAFPNASAVEVWERERFMAGVSGASCTRALKKRARQHWQNEHRPDFHILGFTFDEVERHNRFVKFEMPNVLPVLIENRVTKQDCYAIIREAGIDLPRSYRKGYPNANCIGCVKASSPTYWNHVRSQDPDVFEARADQADRLGVKLVRVRGKRISLRDLHPDEKGRPMKDTAIECGIFCEDKSFT